MTFVRVVPGDDALITGLVYPGTAGLRIDQDGSASGLSAAGGYVESGLAFWMDSPCRRSTLLDLGSVWAGFHANMAGAGPSIGLAVTSGGSNYYAARYAVDPRSAGRTVQHFEFDYAEGFGFTAHYNGEQLTPAATGGSDAGIEAYVSSIAVGCDIQGNHALTRASAIVGDDWQAASASSEVSNALTGGVVWVSVGRSPGIWSLYMDMENDLNDDSVGSTIAPRWMPITSQASFVDPEAVVPFVPTGNSRMIFRRMNRGQAWFR